MARVLTPPGLERCGRCRHTLAQHARDGRYCAGCQAPCVFRQYHRVLIADHAYAVALSRIRTEQRRLMREHREAEAPCARCSHPRRLHAVVAPWCAHRDCARLCAFRPAPEARRPREPRRPGRPGGPNGARDRARGTRP